MVNVFDTSRLIAGTLQIDIQHVRQVKHFHGNIMFKCNCHTSSHLQVDIGGMSRNVAVMLRL